MKTTTYYEQKILQANKDIERWKLAIELLKNPLPLKQSKEPTKIVSVRVPIKDAERIRKEIFKLLDK